MACVLSFIAGVLLSAKGVSCPADFALPTYTDAELAIPTHEDRNLAQTQPRPSGWNANLPPVEYDHPFKGRMTIRIASTKALAKICYLALTTEACARLRAGICEVYIASDFYRDQIMLRHEIGHCNGWGSHHFGMRWVKTSD